MKKRKKRRLKKKNLFILLLIIFAFITCPIILNKKKTNQDSELNYSKDSSKIISEELSKDNQEYLKEHNIKEKDILPIVKETYYIDDYLPTYLDYQEKNPDKTPKEIVTAVNTHINNDFYTNTIKTDTSLGKYVLLNKYYYADENYKAEDLIEIDSTYSLYGDKYKIELSKECFDAFLKMYNDAKDAGYGFKINSAYRSYEKQNTIYNNYVNTDGKANADTYSARPGHSEHQTGYAFDVRDYPFTNDDYSKTKSFTWVSENAYKYGFIIRFPENKEYITGYQYESWHYRYCGIECSTYIHNHDITFEEYYEYFIKYKNPRNLKD